MPCYNGFCWKNFQTLKCNIKTVDQASFICWMWWQIGISCSIIPKRFLTLISLYEPITISVTLLSIFIHSYKHQQFSYNKYVTLEISYRHLRRVLLRIQSSYQLVSTNNQPTISVLYLSMRHIIVAGTYDKGSKFIDAVWVPSCSKPLQMKGNCCKIWLICLIFEKKKRFTTSICDENFCMVAMS